MSRNPNRGYYRGSLQVNTHCKFMRCHQLSVFLLQAAAHACLFIPSSLALEFSRYFTYFNKSNLGYKVCAVIVASLF